MKVDRDCEAAEQRLRLSGCVAPVRVPVFHNRLLGSSCRPCGSRGLLLLWARPEFQQWLSFFQLFQLPEVNLGALKLLGRTNSLRQAKLRLRKQRPEAAARVPT